MPILSAFGLLLCLAIFLVPAWLLRRQKAKRAQDYFVASQYTPPTVIRNSSVVYALRMASFGPFFVLGARGDLWPVIVSSVFFGLGIYLLYRLRRPLLAFMSDALDRDRSITVHEFIARCYGDDVRVRLLASSLTLIALLGLAAVEAFGLASLLQPLLMESAVSVPLLMLGLLLATAACTLLAGNSGVMHSAQLQLGILYLGLFGSTALLLYLHISALTPLPPHAMLAVIFLAACCAAIAVYRRSKYVDTSPLTVASEIRGGGSSVPLGARPLRRFEKILNVCISVFAALVVVVALMEFYSAGLPVLARESMLALRTPTHIPALGLVAVALLSFLYPIVDMTNWQKMAAAAKNEQRESTEPDHGPAALRKIFVIYAVESPLLWLFIAMVGAIAVAAEPVPAGPDVAQSFIQRLAAEPNEVAALALWLLLISLFAMALSTMSALFSASLCTIRYDLLPALRPELAAGRAQPAEERTARRYTIIVGGGLCLIAFIVFAIAHVLLPMNFTGNTFLALLFAFGCAQLSLAPLILGTIAGRASMSPGWALGILGFGAGSGLAAVIVFFITGSESWLWAAVPACLGAGFLLFAIARLRPAKPATAP